MCECSAQVHCQIYGSLHLHDLLLFELMMVTMKLFCDSDEDPDSHADGPHLLHV